MLKGRWLSLLALTSVLSVGLVACGDDDDDTDSSPTTAATTGTTAAGSATTGAGSSPTSDNEGETGDDEVTYGNAGFKTITINAGQPIKIGYSAPTTGDLAGIGIPIQNAAALAAEGRQIKGFSIELVSRDDGCGATGGKSAADQLVGENVVAVVGPVCSGAVVASQDVFEAAGITQISPSSTAIGVTAPARGEVFQTFLRTTYSDGIQGPAQAEFAYNDLDAKTAYVVFDTDAYGSGLRDAFIEAFEELGGEIVGSPEGFAKGATDFQSIVTNITNEEPDVVYFAGFYSEATPFIQQLRSADEDVLFLASDGVKNDEFLSGAGDDAEGTYQSLPSPSYDTDAYTEFGDAYEEAYDQARDVSPYMPEAYDAMTIILDAIEEVAEEQNGNLVIDLEALNETIRDMELQGASGTIRFDARGDNVGGETPVSLFVVRNGAYEEVTD